MSFGRPEVEVVMTADDSDLSDDLDRAESKLLDMPYAGAIAGAGLAAGLTVASNAVVKLVGWLEAAEDKFEEFTKESRKHLRDYGAEIQKTRDHIVMAFGQIWDAMKTPFEAEIVRQLPSTEEISIWAEVLAERFGVASRTIIDTYNQVKPVLTGLRNITLEALPGPAREIFEGFRIGGMTLWEMFAPSEEELQRLRDRNAAVKATMESVDPQNWYQGGHLLAQPDNFFTQFAFDAARAKKEAEEVQEVVGKIQGATRDFGRNLFAGAEQFAAGIDKQYAERQKRIDDAAERFRKAEKDLADHMNRDQGFQATMQSVTGLYRRIQTSAASRPAEDMVAKKLEERKLQAKQQWDEAKKFQAEQKGLLEQIVNKVGTAVWQ